jgi:high-affinity Fe2+/Pb2+ permease
MAERVRDFLRAHQTDGVGQGLGLAKLEELIERANVLAGQQRNGVAMSQQATKQRKEVRRALQTKILRYLRVVGKVAAKQKGELANQFPLPPGNASQQALLTAARATLKNASGQKDVLVSLGMSQKVLEDLAAALAEFDQTLEATREARRDHVGASADLDAVFAEIAEQVQLLDGVVKYQFGENAELMGAWHSARNVLGPFKTKNGPPAGAGGSGIKVA